MILGTFCGKCGKIRWIVGYPETAFFIEYNSFLGILGDSGDFLWEMWEIQVDSGGPENRVFRRGYQLCRYRG